VGDPFLCYNIFILSIQGFSVRSNRWAEISERLRRYFKLGHYRKVVKSTNHRGKLLPLRISPALPLVAPAFTSSPGLQKWAY
jgi:hypothetical protein